MKAAYLLLLAIVIGSTASGQQKYKWPEGTMPNVPLFKDLNGGVPPKFYQQPQRDSILSLFKQRVIPPGVYRLPQDGMPCIVPDMKGYTPIPNAAPVVQLPFRTTIPNKAPYAFPKPFVR